MGDDEPYDDTYVPPAISTEGDARTISFQTRILNQHLVCTLCMGYFNDACTIIECLHTFCRACIMRHFRESSMCPQCELSLGTNPRDLVRTDRTLQSIVDKVFPPPPRQPPGGAATAEADDDMDVGESVGAGADELPPTEENGADEGADAGEAAADSSGAGAVEEEISFSLHEHEESSRHAESAPLQKPYLRTKAQLSMSSLRKYLAKKMGLPAETTIEFYCRGEPLDPALTLEEIGRTIWNTPDETEDLVLHYRVG